MKNKIKLPIFTDVKIFKGDTCVSGHMEINTELKFLKLFIPKNIDGIKLIDYDIIIDNHSINRYMNQGCTLLMDVIFSNI